MLLEGKIVIIAGIGPGLGRATALACAAEGADVALAARTPGKLAAVATEVEALGRRALRVPTDLAEADDCERLMAATIGEFGRIDGVVNNAFVMPPFEELPTQPVETIQKSFDINLFAPLRLSQAVLPKMFEQAAGSIVMILSSVLRQTRPQFGAYKMAKHALLGMSRALAEEAGPRGVRVNSVAPGFIGDATVELVAKIQAASGAGTVAEVKQSVNDTMMLRRAPEPEEIAQAIVFFLSDRSSAITGQCLDVNSGEFSH